MNKIEEVFFKTFELKKQIIYLVIDMGQSHICDKETLLMNKHLFKKKSRRCYVKAVNWVYPEITAEKLLRLICILNDLTGRLTELCSDDINTLKEEILKICLSNFEVFRLSYKKEFLKQVQRLFEE